MRSQQVRSQNKLEGGGYGWVNCNCCPYGYHIDLDFVRYCESISQETDRTGSIKRRRDRRRQRQSMEVLLGLTPPVIASLDQTYKTIPESPDARRAAFGQGDFDDALFDFEQTLKRSKKTCNNLPDVTAVSALPMHTMGSPSGSSVPVMMSSPDSCGARDFDTVSIESCGLSPAALQNIREQMALSLERTRELEEQVKMIPVLKAQLAALKEEKRKLLLQLKTEEQIRMNALNGNFINRHRSRSFTEVDNIDNLNRKQPPPPPPRKDFGVMCGVLTRNVGVGHQYPIMKTVSTITVNGDGTPNFTDKWYNEKIKFLTNQNENLIHNYQNETKYLTLITVAKETQTPLPRMKLETSTQTRVPKQIEIKKVDGFSQTREPKKTVVHIACSVRPSVSEVPSQTLVETRTVGSYHDTPCQKCSVQKVAVAVGPETAADAHVSPVSLASLTVPRSKSFHLGEDKLGIRNRTVGSQYETSPNHVACQHEQKMHSKYCQHEIIVAHRSVQYEKTSTSQSTDTKDLTPPRIHVACEAKESVKRTLEFGCNTVPIVPEKSPCLKCAAKEKEEIARKDGSPTPSRIPRPQIPTTPVEARKFRRQDTYTKIPGSPTEKPPHFTFSGLSGLDLPIKPASNESPISRIESKVQEHIVATATTSTPNGIPPASKVQIQETATLPAPETPLNQIAQKLRKKAYPSKEMQAAMKVVNDCLQKNPNKNVKNQLKNATNVIQQEWFKVSSLVTANPLDVEDYLDAFEDVSSALLEYIVNMTDASGNTAMHYAVSHGNFDVVSILLDSKVCDINKPNKAGYTSVMLVSLAEVSLESHANVVRRLFHMADVNVRAKQHGQTALMLAVSHGRLDMVIMLLEAGADINIQDEDGSTALMCAAEHGHIEIVKHFLSHPDCDSTKTDVDGSTALKIAMEAEHRHIGVLLYAHERSLQALKHKKSKSTSASPKTPSSPLPHRSTYRALSETKHSK